MGLVGAWWNQRWGSARRDIRLEAVDEVWTVEATDGGKRLGRWAYRDEPTARAAVQLLIDGDEMHGRWKDITGAYRLTEQAAERRRGSAAPL